MKASILIICLTCSVVVGCSNEDKSSIYSDLVDELISGGHIYPAPQTEEEERQWDKAWKRYQNSHFNQEVYQHLQDSTLRVIKNAEQKWLLFYGSKMRHVSDWEEEEKSWLKDFIDEDFPSTIVSNLIDTLTTPANVGLNDLKISYLDIVFKNRDEKSGPCSLIFSKASFNQTATKAIVCYEWCNRSELLYVVASNGEWKIQKSARLASH